jgi:L-rhamnose-H+ transport protein
MLFGVFMAVIAGIMLGFYALPEKFTKEFEFENTWGAFFTTALFIIPPIVGFIFINGFGNVLSSIPFDVLIKMVIASFLWGAGVMLWGKAINHIGMSLGFSLFIGSLILVGTLLPFIVDGVPETNTLITILVGISIVLIGVFANGKAGIERQKDEDASVLDKPDSKSMLKGIFIAVSGGVLATGFSFANAVGRPVIHEAVMAQGNAEWVTALAIMFVIYVSGGLFVVPYFITQLTKKELWGRFKTIHLGRNIGMTSTMAILNFAASAAFAFAAFKLGNAGNSVGYAIYNASSVVVAIMSGILTREWIRASSKAKSYLYIGLISIVVGVIVIAIANSIGA